MPLELTPREVAIAVAAFRRGFGCGRSTNATAPTDDEVRWKVCTSEAVVRAALANPTNQKEKP